MLKNFEHFAGRAPKEPVAHRGEPYFTTTSNRETDDTESVDKQSIMREVSDEIKKYNGMDRYEVIRKSNHSCAKLYIIWLRGSDDLDLILLLNRVMNIFVSSMYSLANDFVEKKDIQTAISVFTDLKGFFEIYDLDEHEMYSSVKNEIKKLKSLL